MREKKRKQSRIKRRDTDNFARNNLRITHLEEETRHVIGRKEHDVGKKRTSEKSKLYCKLGNVLSDRGKKGKIQSSRG